MAHEWHELTDLTGGRLFNVERVRMRDTGVAIEGNFELPPLARLRYEDQVFVAAFLHSHGSIKDMEKAFGISYPTVKNRLNRIVEQLQLVVDNVVPEIQADNEDVLGMLDRGEITAAEAAERLRR